MLKDIADKEERAKLSRMGMEGEPVTLQLSSENLLQVKADVRFDEDVLEAQSFLEEQFPADFPKDVDPQARKGPPPPTAEEIEKQKQQEFLRYAERVTEEATASRDRILDAMAEE